MRCRKMFDGMLKSVADKVVSDGISTFIWGEEEITESLRNGYKSKQVNKYVEEDERNE